MGFQTTIPRWGLIFAMPEFKNRTDAGQRLAQALQAKAYDNPVILALPRGGVPVGLEVARALDAPMDLVMVRKIGLPGQPELAVAAIVNGGHPQTVINHSIAAQAGLTAQDIDRLSQAQLDEIKRRRGIYMKGRNPAPLKGRTAILVDDGVATGATIRASLLAVRRQAPAKLVLAVPVAASDTLRQLRNDADDVICLSQPQPFFGVGAHYEDFTQTTDQDVIQLMKEAEHFITSRK